METKERGEVIVFKDIELLAHYAAEQFVRLAKLSIAQNGRFSVALSGGSTPKIMYGLLAGDLGREVDWSKVFLFWGDERFVPLDHPDSTYRMVKEILIDKVAIPKANIFAVPTRLSIEEACKQYASMLPEQFDLILLGMGADGHTASLFPYSPALSSQDAVAIELNSPKPPAQRLTFTFNTINNAKNIIVLVSGADKAQTLASVLKGDLDVQKYPIQGVKSTMWLVDSAAGVLIK